ncbi:MAG: hypothetical protein ABII12_11295, partial [Planctomycetota bacterium]
MVLVMVALLALLSASYAFMVRANLSSVMARHQRFQAKMAAESGLQHVITILRRHSEDPDYTEDIDVWYDNEDAFLGGLVSGLERDDKLQERREEDATYDASAKPAWRFNLVAPNWEDPETVRYGITDECARLDLNRATETQLRLLFETVIPDDQDNPVEIDVLVDSLMDWRERGSGARPNGAKDAYYQELTPPYRCKSGEFSTVEELLLVRGFTAWVLFGEDYNRNMLLDANEDDGEESFPPDNADNELFPGIAPYLTVWSRELNTSMDRRPRINLNMQDTEKLQELLEEDFDGGIISYVMDIRRLHGPFNSVMELLPAPPPPEEEELPAEDATELVPVQGEEGETTSQPADENAEGNGADLSDLEQSENTSEKESSFQWPVFKNLTDDEPPAGEEDLPLILDRLTVDDTPVYAGRINVSTASPAVLSTMVACLPGEPTPEEIDAIVSAIVSARSEVSGEERATPAWLLSSGALDETKFRVLLDGKDLVEPKPGGIITARSSVFRVETIGYADHVGVVERLNVVFELRGPIAQVLYHRNLTGLGPA